MKRSSVIRETAALREYLTNNNEVDKLNLLELLHARHKTWYNFSIRAETFTIVAQSISSAILQAQAYVPGAYRLYVRTGTRSPNL